MQIIKKGEKREIRLLFIRRSVEEVDSQTEGFTNRSIGLFNGDPTEDIAKRGGTKTHIAYFQTCVSHNSIFHFGDWRVHGLRILVGLRSQEMWGINVVNEWFWIKHRKEGRKEGRKVFFLL